jgi:hypothetical protein
MSNRVLAAGVCVPLFLGLATAPAPAQKAERVSVSSAGFQANGASLRPCLDHDGRLVAFQSDAVNLVPGDTNGATDVFLRRRPAGLTERVSVNSMGGEGNGASDSAHLSANGAFVVFRSDATNLVANDLNGLGDLFFRDLAGGTTGMITRGVGGGPANGESRDPFVTATGRVVIFTSAASNLVPGDGNGLDDVFVFDVTAGVMECVSVDGFGAIAANRASSEPCLSANGRIAAFVSEANNLVPGDSNKLADVFLRDRVTGVTRLISRAPTSVGANGASSQPSLSANGAFVAYRSLASNLVGGDMNGRADVFRFDRSAVTTSLVSVAMRRQGNGDSFEPVISADGSRVAFLSAATNLVPRDLNVADDLFVRDATLGITHRASLRHDLHPSLSSSSGAALSGDGRFAAWSSDGPDFVTGDTNGIADVFVRESIDATWMNYGWGWPGNLGVPSIAPASDPILRSDTTILIGNSNPDPAGTTGFLVIGWDPAQTPTALGGDLFVDPWSMTAIVLPVGGLQHVQSLPGAEWMEGSSLYLQALVLDPWASHGVSFTPGLELRLGW